jgi:GH24 family phage-related lysozyme (muramidase)|tara:strand:+ start:1387 stop:1821 length:435 start_codon:yes stop_codon:yes gene_type:complete
MEFEELKERIKIHEGYRDTIYLDSLGKKTIGYGHLITATDKFVEGTKYSKEELEQTFLEDFNKAVDGAKRVTDFDKLHSKAKEIAIECCFVLGAKGFSAFKLTIGHLNEGRWTDASSELKNSLWYRNQATNRVSALCEILESIK